MKEEGGVLTYQREFSYSMEIEGSTEISVVNTPVEHKQLQSVFKAYRNTIDIYTEDKIEDKEFYVQLLSRLLDNTDVKIRDVHPLGCRQNVVKCCKEDQSERPKIYIVDGDIYLQYEESKNIPNLHVLDAYCIENLLVCEEALCKVAYSWDGTKPLNEIKQKLDFHNTIQGLLNPLIDLFFNYSIQSELCGKFKLLHINSYLRTKGPLIDPEMIDRKIGEIKKTIIDSGYPKERYDKLLSKRRRKFSYSEETLLMIVSGKDFIIPFFQRHIKEALKGKESIPNRVLKFNLAEKCDLNKLGRLKNDILSA